MEYQDAIAIFPEEVWKMLLEYFITGKDSSFPQQASTSKKPKSNNIFPFMLLSHQFVKYPSKQNVLDTRQVCKLWKNIVDKFLESERFNIDYSSLDSHDAGFRHLFEMNISKAQKRLRKGPVGVLKCFKENFQKTQENPIVSRSLNITLDCLSNGFLEFLKVFGTHVWYFTLSIERFGSKLPKTPVDITKFLWNVLEYLPNLKTLKLRIYQDMGNFNSRRPEDDAHLKKFLEDNTFPNVPNLVNLEVKMDPYLQLIQEVLESSVFSQLKYYTKLDCHGLNLIGTMDNLQQFCWKVSEQSLYSTGSLEIQVLAKFKNLKKLCIDLNIFRHLSQCYNLCPTSILKGIEKYNTKLEVLSVAWETWQFDFPPTLELGWLERLIFTIAGAKNLNAWSFSFMKCMKKLKILQLHFSDGDYSTLTENKYSPSNVNLVWCIHSQSSMQKCMPDDQTIDVLQCLDTLDTFYCTRTNATSKIYNSNIWAQVPRLQIIYVGIVSEIGYGADRKIRSQTTKLECVYQRKP